MQHKPSHSFYMRTMIVGLWKQENCSDGIYLYVSIFE